MSKCHGKCGINLISEVSTQTCASLLWKPAYFITQWPDKLLVINNNSQYVANRLLSPNKRVILLHRIQLAISLSVSAMAPKPRRATNSKAKAIPTSATSPPGRSSPARSRGGSSSLSPIRSPKENSDVEDDNEQHPETNESGLKAEDEESTNSLDRDGDLEEVHACPDNITFRYPSSVPDFTILSQREKAFKVARFLQCTAPSCVCTGLEPPAGGTIRITKHGTSNEDEDDEDEDDDVSIEDSENPLDFEDRKDEWRTKEGWWRTCGKCGHGWESGGHVWAADVPPKERTRRGKVVGRIEEILEVSLRLCCLRN